MNISQLSPRLNTFIWPRSYSVYGAEKRRWPIYATFGMILIGYLAVGWIVFAEKSKQPRSVLPSAALPAEVTVAKPEPKVVKGRYMFSGTIVLARAVELGAKSGGNYNYEQPFSQLSTFEPEKYDGWLADLECPVTGNNVSFEEQIDKLIFNCRPEWMPAFSKYFKFANLANNHTSDMGREGFLETQKHLDQAGVQTVGHYNPAEKDDTCEVMSFPVKVQDSDGKQVKGTLPVAVCAWHYFSYKPAEGQMETMERYAKIMPVISLMHVGVEYLPTAGRDQVNIARRLIDLGSEFVIGNSPHWVQNSESYKGKLIAYSTGNFIFDQIEPETQRGLSIDTTFEIDYDKNIAKWLALGEQCGVRRDGCLEKAEAQGLTKYKLRLKHEPVASIGGNKKVTKKADPAIQKAVEERLNWDRVKSELE